MPHHLSDHWKKGACSSIFTINRKVPMGLIIEQLILTAGASDEKEYIDEIKYLPL